MRNEERQSCTKIKDVMGRLAQEEGEVRKIWKEYFENLYNIDTQEKIAVHMCSFDGILKGNYFRGRQIRRTEIEVRVRKLKNEKETDKDEITG